MEAWKRVRANGGAAVGKPYEGKPHVRFDEEGQEALPFTL